MDKTISKYIKVQKVQKTNLMTYFFDRVMLYIIFDKHQESSKCKWHILVNKIKFRGYKMELLTEENQNGQHFKFYDDKN